MDRRSIFPIHKLAWIVGTMSQTQTSKSSDMPEYEYTTNAQLDVLFFPYQAAPGVDDAPLVHQTSAQPPSSSPPPSSSSSTPSPLQVKVIKPFSPFTMSATMLVEITAVETDSGDRGSPVIDAAPFVGKTCVLKLYDRRAALNCRRSHYGPERLYDAEIEAKYQAWRAHPKKSRIDVQKWNFLKRATHRDNDAVFEAWLAALCEQNYHNESQVYQACNARRACGTDISCPRFYGCVRYESDIGPINGILVEHITPSISLERYILQTATCPKMYGELAKICDQAMVAMGSMHDASILNQDVHARNIVVQLSQRKSLSPQRPTYPGC